MFFNLIKTRNSLYFLIADIVEKSIKDKFPGSLKNYKNNPGCSSNISNTCGPLVDKVKSYGDDKIDNCCVFNRNIDNIFLNSEVVVKSIYESMLTNIKDYNLEDINKEIISNIVNNVLKNYNNATFDSGYEISHKLFVSFVSGELTDILLKKNKIEKPFKDTLIDSLIIIFLIVYLYLLFLIYKRSSYVSITKLTPNSSSFFKSDKDLISNTELV